MWPIHRSNSNARHHNFIDKKSFAQFSPTLLYIGELKKTNGWSETAHTHDFLEVLFVFDGCGTIYTGNEQCQVCSGDIIIYNSGVEHFEINTIDEPMHAYFAAFSNIKLKDLPENCILSSNSKCIFNANIYSTEIFSMFSFMNNEVSAKNNFYIEITENIAKVLLIYIIRIICETNTDCALIEKDDILKKALDYIDKNFNKPIGLSNVASACFTNKYYLSHVFSDKLGFTVGQAIHKKRIDLAKNLLTTSNKSLAEISRMCGFTDPNYFSRQFKKSTLTTPMQYRKNQ